jgi:hypothetical protein
MPSKTASARAQQSAKSSSLLPEYQLLDGE